MSFDLADVRAQFPILSRKVRGKDLVYLDNAASTQKPSSVIEAERDLYRTYYANVHRGVHTLSAEASARFEQAREKVAAFIGAADPACVLFTRGTTESVNLVAYAWGRANLKEGDEILLTEMEHHSNLVPWQILAQEKGVKLRHVPMTADGRLDLAALPSLLGPKTKLFSFTAVSNALGTVNPVSELVAAGKKAGAVVFVDAAQLAPHARLDVFRLGADFAAFSGHKIGAPTGIGVLWGRRELLEAMPPFQGGGDMISQVGLERSTWNELPYKFEAGTPNIAGVIGLGEAVAWLDRIDMTAAAEHEAALAARAAERLRAEEGVTVYGPLDPALRRGVVSFNIEGVHAHDVGTFLDADGVAVRAGHHCCQPLMKRLGVSATARASFWFYNQEKDVEALVKGVRKVKDFFKVPA